MGVEVRTKVVVSEVVVVEVGDWRGRWWRWWVVEAWALVRFVGHRAHSVRWLVVQVELQPGKILEHRSVYPVELGVSLWRSVVVEMGW